MQSKPWYRWYVVGVLTAVYASSQVDRQIMGMLLEPIKLELGANDTQMGFLVGLTFAVFYATLGMPIAMLADRSNRRNIVTAAISIWSAMTVVCGYAATFVQLALARIGVGVGEAGSSPPSHSMIADLFGPKERGTAMGVFALGVNIGLLIAYLGGGWLSEHYGWRMTFVAVGLPGLLIAAILYFTVAEPKRGAIEVTTSTDNDARWRAICGGCALFAIYVLVPPWLDLSVTALSYGCPLSWSALTVCHPVRWGSPWHSSPAS